MERIGKNINTETLDKLYLEWSQFTDARTERELELARLYDELIMQVQMKYPGETRHETALRHIRQAEAPSDNAPQQADTD